MFTPEALGLLMGQFWGLLILKCWWSGEGGGLDLEASPASKIVKEKA